MWAVRVLAFEDHYDIEAMLAAGGVNTDALVIEQRWNSTDAVERIRAFAPDVLLLDHYMPPMNGYQVLEALLPRTFSDRPPSSPCRAPRQRTTPW